MVPFVRRDDGSYVITIPRSLYRCSAIKKAAYKFTDLFDISIDEPSPEAIVVTLFPKPAADPDCDPTVRGLWNEVLDQDLRESIAEETNGIRDLILAQAFSQVSVFHPELDRPLEQAAKEADPSGASQ